MPAVGDWLRTSDLPAELPVAGAGPGLWLGKQRAVLVVERGDDREQPGVRSREVVEWSGPLAPADGQRLLRLTTVIIARDRDGRLRYLGDARVASLGGRGPVVQLALSLHQPLSYDLLDWVRPEDEADHATPLAWLPLVDTDRVAAMRGFLHEWYGPLAESDGIADAVLDERELPPALRALHGTIGNRPDLLEFQDRFVPVAELVPRADGLLTFYVENQGVFSARIDPRSADPDVYLWDLEAEPLREREPLSGYLLQAVLLEAAWRSWYANWCIASDPVRTAVIAPLERVPLAPWHWPGDPCEVFVGPALIAVVNRNDADWDILVAARSRKALRYLRDIEAQWEGG
jgi:hypothetical protein